MSEPRIQRGQRDGRVVWTKRFSDAGRHWRMAMLRQLARRLGAEPLLAPVPLGAIAACATERAMIERLQRLGLRVPAILEGSERHLVLSDLGPTLAACCRQAQAAEDVEVLIKAGFAAVADLHHRGGYVSQAVARNMTFEDGVVGFIDLEEDPATVMSLAAAQARDTLFYVHSTARFLADDGARFQCLLAQHLQQETGQVRDLLFSTARSLSWLASLTRPFGRRSRGVGLAIEHLVAAASAPP